ncbi:DUF6603 domain-containing protein [Streptomyces sp. NPDC001941]|uniref:DUF6603 domain-containing protein n=1 Tax=Streptomyces sp. NPDC001941 TaxID=3154659 RepID=UPI00332CD96E
MRLLYATQNLTRAQTEQINRKLVSAGVTEGIPTLTPEQGGPAGGGVPAGACIGFDYVVPGAGAQTLLVPLSRKGATAGNSLSSQDTHQIPRTTGPNPPETGPAPTPLPDENPTAPAESTPRAPAAQVPLEGVVVSHQGGEPPVPAARAGLWADVGRSFGPLLVQRLGLNYDQGVAWVMLDASLGAGGLTMIVRGMALGLDLNGDTAAVRARLEGLGVEFIRPPLQIGGSLVNRPDPNWDVLVEGSVVAQLPPKLGIMAVGAYQRKAGGAPSLFVFGRAAGKFGGPPPFHVTGFALGFGYNSSVRIPERGQIGQFPLVSGLDGGLPESPTDMLARLTGGGQPWVTPLEGQVWGAAGLDFTSFEFIQGRLLAVLEAGSAFTLALLGQASATFPKAGRKPYAKVALELRIVYSSAKGSLEASAQLFDSYVIDPACALTGGFALYQWFDPSPYAGDFCLTVGGYHGKFKAPAHYPQVPRLGFSWSLGSTVNITGQAYMALTPRAVMAGGRLEVAYRSGKVSAWLTAALDALIQWEPLFFDVSLSIRIGAKVKLLFTVSGEMGADLNVWGPPTGGKVTAKFAFVKVTINFGKSRQGAAAVDWPTFAARLLPPQAPLQILAASGLLPERETPPADVRAGRIQPLSADQEGRVWQVDPGGASFRITTVVPASIVKVNDTVQHTGTKLNIRAMKKKDLTSTLRVTVNYTTSRSLRDAIWQSAPDLDLWHFDVENNRVPFSLWGEHTQDPNNPATPDLIDHTGVLRVTIPEPRTDGQSLGPVKEAALQWETLDRDGVQPLRADAAPVGDRLTAASEAGTHLSLVAEHLADRPSVLARAAVLAALKDLAPQPYADDPAWDAALWASDLLDDAVEQLVEEGWDQDVLVATGQQPPADQAWPGRTVWAVFPEQGRMDLLDATSGTALNTVTLPEDMAGEWLLCAARDAVYVMLSKYQSSGMLHRVDATTWQQWEPLATGRTNVSRTDYDLVETDQGVIVVAGTRTNGIFGSTIDPQTRAVTQRAAHMYDVGSRSLSGRSGTVLICDYGVPESVMLYGYNFPTGHKTGPLDLEGRNGTVMASPEGGISFLNVQGTTEYVPVDVDNDTLWPSVQLPDSRNVGVRASKVIASGVLLLWWYNPYATHEEYVSRITAVGEGAEARTSEDRQPLAYHDTDTRTMRADHAGDRVWLTYKRAVLVVDAGRELGPLTFAADITAEYLLDDGRMLIACQDATITVVAVVDGHLRKVDLWTVPHGAAKELVFTDTTGSA